MKLVTAWYRLAAHSYEYEFAHATSIRYGIVFVCVCLSVRRRST